MFGNHIYRRAEQRTYHLVPPSRLEVLAGDALNHIDSEGRAAHLIPLFTLNGKESLVHAAQRRSERLQRSEDALAILFTGFDKYV